jgi:hypothetical protein
VRKAIGIILVLMGAGALIGDVLAAEHGFRLRAVGEVWFKVHPNSLQLLQPGIERHIAVWLWDPVVLTLLTWPLAPVLAVPGLLLLLLGRRKKSGRRSRR